jgi:hypothetical protein
VSTNQRDEPDDIAEADSAERDGVDPRDTDHPTGPKQARENAANDPPS